MNSGKNALRKSNPNRSFGLGACPSVDALRTCLGSKFDAIPVIDFVTLTIDLPVLREQIPAFFGETVRFFGFGEGPIPGVIAVDTSFVGPAGLLQTDIFVIGLGIHVFAEPTIFSQIGNGITPLAGGAIPPSPDVFTLNDVQDGALGPQFVATATAAASASITPAAMEWGAPAQRAAWQAANAYRVVFTVNNRCNIIDEMLADFAYFAGYGNGVGFGDSDVPVMPFVQRMNARYLSACCTANGPAFWPVTHRRVGSTGATGATPTTSGTNVGDFHPTTDFKLAAAAWGGLENNQVGCCQPFRKICPKPWLIERGDPIAFSLEVSNPYHYAQFLTEISASGAPLNGNGTVPELDAPLPGSSGGYTQGGPPFGPTGGVMPELTLDAAPVNVSQQVLVQQMIYKGGALKFSFLLKGYEVMRDWCVFLAGCDANGTLFLSNGNVYSGGGPGYSIPGLVPAGGVPGAMAGVPGQGR